MIDVEVRSGSEAVGARAVQLVADAIGRTIANGRRSAWAISGGETAVPVFRRPDGDRDPGSPPRAGRP